ncbi:MAG: hypothetical protein Q8L53_07815 [Aestuariivirga sp.]|nr:hypothetical protein [Aestuariivirga sp.]
MKKLSTLLLVALLASSLMACSTVKKFTGQRDDSILPGSREDILTPEQQTARDPEVMGKKTAPCNPDDLNCVDPSSDQEAPEIDQESSTAQ